MIRNCLDSIVTVCTLCPDTQAQNVLNPDAPAVTWGVSSIWEASNVCY